jgi:hypothetical protein
VFQGFDSASRCCHATNSHVLLVLVHKAHCMTVITGGLQGILVMLVAGQRS